MFDFKDSEQQIITHELIINTFPGDAIYLLP